MGKYTVYAKLEGSVEIEARDEWEAEKKARKMPMKEFNLELVLYLEKAKK